jgi:hypothetical protein
MGEALEGEAEDGAASEGSIPAGEKAEGRSRVGLGKRGFEGLLGDGDAASVWGQDVRDA